MNRPNGEGQGVQGSFLLRPAVPSYQDPLILKMVNGITARPRYSLDEVYERTIARLRKYSAHAIVETVLRVLAIPAKSRMEDLERVPWLSLLVVKWALQDSRVKLNFAPRNLTYPEEEHHRILQELWSFNPQKDQPSGLTNGWQLLRRVFHAQHLFQREQDLGFLRWPALLSRLSEGHPCRRQFREATSMEPDDFSELAMVMLTFIKQAGTEIHPPMLASVLTVYGTRLESFLEMFARDLGGLRTDLTSKSAYRLLGEAELREFPYLQRFPLYRSARGSIRSWHPMVFSQGIEHAPHLRMMLNGQSYSDAFSKVFEKYVTELTTQACPQAVVEASYKAKIAGCRTKEGKEGKAVEALVPFGTCNVFIEAKLSIFHDIVLLGNSEQILADRLRPVRDAMEQAYAVSADVRREGWPLCEEVGSAGCDYLLVVVSRQLLLGSGIALQRILPDTNLAAVDDAVRQRMPLHHVFIMDLADFENVIECVRQGWVDLPTLLERAAKNNLGGDSRLTLFEHISLSDGQQLRPPLRHGEAQSVMERLRRAFNLPDF